MVLDDNYIETIWKRGSLNVPFQLFTLRDENGRSETENGSGDSQSAT
jgi:hypothetical protein